MGLPRPRRIEPVRQSPRLLMFGSFTQGTVHLSRLNSLTRRLAPTVIVRRLPTSHSACRLLVARLSPHLQVPRSGPTTGAASFALSLYAYRLADRGATREPRQFSRGHASFFRTMPPANTLVRWVNE